MKWEDLSIDARQWMQDMGEYGPTVNVANREIKGYDMDGKNYLTSEDLRGLAAACIEVAAWLDKRAEESAPRDPHQGGA